MPSVRIAGVLLPGRKRVAYALPYIYGVGLSMSRQILTDAHVDPQKKTEQLTEQEVGRIRALIEKQFRVEGDLRREVFMNVKRLKDIGAYRGARHARQLPVRGQRTRTNSRTVRGNVRRTMGSGRRTAAEKT
ncbi:MAG: 30S ribosomal protein S13 [Candidatus Kerfeldbacteria bacterium]|nr:30S ribosomal protein S13 [Candidatus Kerfeldbacteria bacterium]